MQKYILLQDLTIVPMLIIEYTNFGIHKLNYWVNIQHKIVQTTNHDYNNNQHGCISSFQLILIPAPGWYNNQGTATNDR
jgi:hypothetical protein